MVSPVVFANFWRAGKAKASAGFRRGDDDGSARFARPPRGLGQVRTRITVACQRALWTKRAASWGKEGSADLRHVVNEVLRNIPCDASLDVLDIGSGTGALSLELAGRGACVLAVDVSPAMTTLLSTEAAARGLNNITTMTAAAELLELQPLSLDAVVSNYALHHLHNGDKATLVRAAATWLRPGGRLVIGDMMFGRGASERDRRIIRAKVIALARKGPGGWWRIAKNSVRFLFRLQERPLPIEAWVTLLENAGFVDVTAVPVVAEAAVVVGIRPAAPVERSHSGEILPKQERMSDRTIAT